MNKIFFVLGGPCSGKGLFCKNIVRKFPQECSHLSAGDLLRAFIAQYETDTKSVQHEKANLV